MFVYDVSNTTGSLSISSTSNAIYKYTAPISLLAKQNDQKNLTLKVDILGSSVSGQLAITYAISDKSGGTYAIPLTGSGTSLILIGGTSIGGQYANGSYLIPLTIVASGNTYELKSVPFIKFGHNASYYPVDCEMQLFVG